MSQKVSLVNYVNQYKFLFTIPSDGQKIEFKPITTGQMKNLLAYEEESITTVEKVLDDIIKGCIQTKGFDLDDLTLQDRFNLLLEIRKKSKGNEYDFQAKCGKCGKVGPRGVDLNELADRPFVEPTEKSIKLSDQLTVELDFIKRKHQRMASEIVEGMKDLNDNQMLAQIGTYTYAMSLTKFITPDGEYTADEVDIEDVVAMLDMIDEEAYGKINHWFIDNDFGIVFKTEHMCTFCGNKEEIDIPVAYFFS